MRRAILLAALLLVAGGAHASWSVHGATEPDHPYDANIPRDPDRDPLGLPRIYFNAVVVVGDTWANPNHALLGGWVYAEGAEGAVAYLGFWRDCDRDGYVGSHALGATYPAEALLDRSLCPPASPGGALYPFNDGQVVREMIPIGWLADRAPIPGETRPDVFDDPGARVWGDLGLPRDPFVACSVKGREGTFRGTGALVDHADCATGRIPGLPSDPCAEDPTNVRVPVYRDDPRCPAGPGLAEPGATPTFHVWDCDEGGLRPGFADDPSASSVYSAASGAVSPAAGGCRHGASALDPTYEALFPETRGDGRKRATTFAFSFVDERGSVAPRAPPTSDPSYFARRVGGTLATQTPYAPGLGPIWLGERTSALDLMPERRDLLDDVHARGPRSFSFYAYHPGAFELAGGSPATDRYLSPCPGGRVDCDASRWWDPAHGAPPMPLSFRSERPYGVVPGQPWHMRDVDCLDGEAVRGTGIHVGLAPLSPDACPRV